MASPLRKVRTDEREKPRDLPRDLPDLSSECLAFSKPEHVWHVAAWLFFPQLLRGDPSRIKLHFTKTNSSPWFAYQHRLTIQLGQDLWIAHLNAGEANAMMPIPYEGLIFAIGARFCSDEPVRVLNLDLDGHGKLYDVRDIVAKLQSVGVHGLLVSSSGKPGKFRYLVFLDRWYAVDELRRLTKKLCNCLGLKVGQGSVEIFPSNGNGRLLGGYGALTVYGPTNLDVLTERKLPPFLSMCLAQPRVELARIVDELTCAAEHDKPIACEIIADDDAGKPLLEQAHAECEPDKRVSHKRKKRRVPEHVSRILEHGADPGQRFPTIQALIKHAWFQGMNRQEAVKFVGRWVRQGGIDRTNWMREHDDPIEAQIDDLPRIVDGMYELPAEKPRKIIEDPKNLSAQDVLTLNMDVERVVALGRWPRRIVERFAMDSFRMFKGSRVAGKLDEQGRAKARLHRDRWEKFAGGRADYCALRDAFKIFEAITDYTTKAESKALYGDESHAEARWYALNRPLTQDSPKESLGSTWALAVMRAQKSRKKA